MKHKWQLQDAKNQLSRVVADAKEHGPQTITVHGRPTAVVLSIEEYRKLARPKDSLADFFRRSPLRGVNLRIVRSKDTGRRRVKF